MADGAKRPDRAGALRLVIGACFAAVALALLIRPGAPLSPWRAPNELAPAPPQVSASATSVAPIVSDVSRPSSVGAPPPTLSPDQLANWRARMEDTRAALLEKTRYAPGTHRLAGKTDLIEPNHVEPWAQMLKPKREGSEGGKIVVRQNISRVFIPEGETAIATIEAVDPKLQHQPIAFLRAEVRPLDNNSGEPLAALGTLSFTDDGTGADAKAGDGVYSAYVPPTATTTKGLASDARAEVDLQVGDEQGSVFWALTFTGAAPAKFTGDVRSSVVDGSLAFDIGLTVWKAGTYKFQGRLFDAAGAPMAFLDAIVTLDTSSTSVRLSAYGKALRDQEGKAPFSLRDVEGWTILSGSYPDREVMPILAGPFATASFDVATLTDREWDSPQKRAQIDSFDQAVKAGPSPVAPVDSNGIPLPTPSGWTPPPSAPTRK
jgi:hypothetical protein